MKILVHMGMGKTGTTSLQESLHAASGALRNRGVLYPDFGHQSVTHHLLVALCGCSNRLPPALLQSMGGPEAITEKAKVAWDMLCRDVQRRRPEILVLSSEHLFMMTDGAAKASLVNRLSSLSSDIVPILYIRHPVHGFRATVQQRIKTSNQPIQPHGARLQTAILDTEAAFPTKLQMVAFDRSALHGGDIVADFATRFLSPLVKVTDLPTHSSNVGLSAEALMLMARLRDEGGNSDEVAHKLRRLTTHLEKLDRDDPPAQPLTLLPEVADAALRAAVSHRWLAETGRLQIPGLDISKIDGAPLPDWMQTAPPASLFLHDPKRLDRLRDHPSINPIPRIRDLLLRFLQRKLAFAQDRNTGAAPSGANSARRSSKGDRNEDH